MPVQTREEAISAILKVLGPRTGLYLAMFFLQMVDRVFSEYYSAAIDGVQS
jgi:hypothetical protein